MQMVYDSLIQLILEGARAKGDISSVPDCEALLETAHILSGKGDSLKPVIARFYSRYWRNLVFRNRKEFSPREAIGANTAPSSTTRSSHVRTPRMQFPFFEDLTKAMFTKLQDIKQQEGVIFAWKVNGTIRFKLKDKNTIFRVSKIKESFDEIVG